MRFELVSGWLAIMFFFSCFQGQNFLFKYYSVHTKKVHNMPFINIFFILGGAQNRLNIHNQLCLALLETPQSVTSL